MQRLSEEPVEERPRRAGLEGGPHLAEDLALTGDERVEPAGDAEEVERRRIVAEPVERDREIAGSIAGELGEGRNRLLLGVLVAGHVELGPVAGREHDRLSAEPGRERTAGVEVERYPLAQLDRGAVVRDAGERELHEAKWVRGRTTATSAKPARQSSAERLPRQPSWRSTSRAA